MQNDAPGQHSASERISLHPRVTASQLARIHQTVPQELRDRRIWVIADRSDGGKGKSCKIPLSVHAPGAAKRASSTDPSTWMTFREAMAMAQADDRAMSLGIMLHDQGMVAIDLDHVRVCVDGVWQLTVAARELVARLPPTWSEVSPGRDGAHLFYWGAKPVGFRTVAKDALGDGTAIECYDKGRYITVTGYALDDEAPPVGIADAHSLHALEPYLGTVQPPTERESEHGDQEIDIELLHSALKAIDPDCTRDDWLRVGMALHNVEDGYRMWVDWSRQCEELYDAVDQQKAWESFNQPFEGERPGFGTLCWLADQHYGSPGWRPVVNPFDKIEDKSDVAAPLIMQGGDFRAWMGTASFLVDQLLPERGLAELFGPPEGGKSLMAMHLAVSVASGADLFLGQEIEREGPVLYLIGEDATGIAARFVAECEQQGVDPTTCPVFFGTRPASLSEGEDAAMWARDLLQILQGEVPALVIVDTLAMNFGTGDENSAKDMQAFIGNCLQLSQVLRSLVMCVHHTGVSATERGRGSSALPAAMDATFKVEKNEQAPHLAADAAVFSDVSSGPVSTEVEIVLKPRKAKNWQRLKPLAAQMMVHEVGKRANGQPETAAALRWQSEGPMEPDLPVADQEEAVVMRAILEAVASGGASSRSAIAQLVPVSDRYLRRVLDLCATAESDGGWGLLTATGQTRYRKYEMNDKARKLLMVDSLDSLM